MSVESEILRIQHNIANAYAAVAEKGGQVPLQPTSANLAAAVASIPGEVTEFTAGDGISIEENTISVTTPVRDILTEAEFNDLPETQKNDGFYIIDDGLSSSCEVYSTEETVIGTWIDGKPLYRRVIQITSPATTDSYQYYSISSPPPIENVVKIDGVIHASSGYDSPINCYRGDFWCSTQVGNAQIVVQVFGRWLISRPMDIVVEYTKTTDQASSSNSLTASLSHKTAESLGSSVLKEGDST